jgi:hypothetical protein
MNYTVNADACELPELSLMEVQLPKILLGLLLTGTSSGLLSLKREEVFGQVVSMAVFVGNVLLLFIWSLFCKLLNIKSKTPRSRGSVAICDFRHVCAVCGDRHTEDKCELRSFTKLLKNQKAKMVSEQFYFLAPAAVTSGATTGGWFFVLPEGGSPIVVGKVCSNRIPVRTGTWASLKEEGSIRKIEMKDYVEIAKTGFKSLSSETIVELAKDRKLYDRVVGK